MLARSLLVDATVRIVICLVLLGCAVEDRSLWEPVIESSHVEVVEYRLLAPAEKQRIQNHLTRVEHELRAVPAIELLPAQRVARTANLDQLRRYREQGRFPHNHDLLEPTPVFVDRHGTRCAMADLIEHAGGADLVARVAATNNLVYIRDLAGDAELTAWLTHNGLTLDEAARIQPSYSQINPCLYGAPIDRDLATPGLQAEISATLQVSNAEGVTELLVPECNAPAGTVALPCFRFERRPGRCPGGTGYSIEVEAERDGELYFRADVLVE